MTASIAHEIDQPLGALVNNAGAVWAGSMQKTWKKRGIRCAYDG